MLQGFAAQGLAPSGFAGQGVLDLPNGVRFGPTGALRGQTLSLFATSNQVVFQSDGVTGTLTWTPSGVGKTITIPDRTGTLITNADTGTVTPAMLASSTGLASGAVGDLVYCNATTPTWTRLAAVAVGQVLVSQGASAAPAWSANPGVSSITCTAQSNKLGGAAGSSTSPTTSNTNIVLYGGGSNWAGIGTDTGGSMYFVTGTVSPATRLHIRSDNGYVALGGASSAAWALHVGPGADAPTLSGVSTSGVYATNNGNVALELRDSSNDVSFGIYTQPTYCVVGTITNHQLAICQNNTIRMYFDTSGRVGIGAAPSNMFDVQLNVADYVARIANTNGAANGLRINAGSNTGTGHVMIGFYRPDATLLGHITENTTTSVVYATSSDERLKTDIVPAVDGLDVVRRIDVLEFSFRDDPERRHHGFSAQRLREVYPYAVTIGGDDPRANPWGVDYGRVTPALVLAIQELDREVRALREELARRSN